VARWTSGTARCAAASHRISDNAYARVAELPVDLAAWAVTEFSPALARASSMERNFYGHNRNRTRIARARRPGSSGLLLPHRRLLGLATASAHQPKHQHRNHNRGNGDSTNAELRRLRTLQAVNALEPRGRGRALQSGGNANAARRQVRAANPGASRRGPCHLWCQRHPAQSETHEPFCGVEPRQSPQESTGQSRLSSATTQLSA
jgi:hypothetical protein